MLRTTELDYELPEAAIATMPASPRDSAKLMVIDRAGGTVAHHSIADLPSFLHEGDLLVRNTTTVLPARFRGVRLDTGGKVEGLFLCDVPSVDQACRCRVLLKMRRHRPGVVVRLFDAAGETSPFSLVVEGQDQLPAPATDATERGWLVRVETESADRQNWLAAVGQTPLPPYILAARKKLSIHVTEQQDRMSYQTVFAGEPAAAADRPEHGSVAAPTAGLHFTPELLERLSAAGIGMADVVLHVGLGTFKPVDTEFIETHPMHTEWCMVPASAATQIRQTKANGRRIIAVGTTAARTLESFADVDEMDRLGALSTQLLITPGYRFRHIDLLLTNFHLPRSTLMAMVAALLPGGASQLRELYTDAIARGYRFYSFGDAMLII